VKRYLWGAIAAVVVGVGAPRLEVAVACRRPISEPCVWGRAYLPVNVAATLVILGVPIFGFVARMTGRRARGRKKA